VLAPEDGKVQNFPAYFAPMFGQPGFLWNPFNFCGFPVLADPQIAMFYPVKAFFQLLLPGSIDGFNLYVLSGFVLAAFFAYLYVYARTANFLAALVSGLIYGLSGFTISELRHLQIVHTIAWLPFLLFCADRQRAIDTASSKDGNRSWWRDLCLNICITALGIAMLIFAGHPQTAVYAFIVFATYCVFCSVGSGGKKISLLILSLAALFGFAIASVQILPTMQLAHGSIRPSFTMHDFLVGEVTPTMALGFTMPYILGGNYSILESSMLETVPFSQQGPPLGLLYMGYLPLLLAFYSLTFMRRRPILWFFLIWALIAIIFSLGRYGGVSSFFASMPVIGSFRGLYRALFIVILYFAVASGFAIARLDAVLGSARGICSGLFAGRSERGLHGWFNGLLKHWKPRKHLLLLVAIFVAVLIPPLVPALVPLLCFVFSRGRPWARGLLFASTALVLQVYAANSQWTVECPKAADMAQPPWASVLRERLASGRFRILTVKGIYGGTDEIPPNLNRIWSIYSASGYEPLVSARYAEIMHMSEGGFLQPPWRIEAENRAFDIISAVYLITPRTDLESFNSKALSEGAREFFQPNVIDDVFVFENTRALPRCRFAQEIIELSPAAIVPTVRTGRLPSGREYDPRTMVLIEEPLPAGLKPQGSASASNAGFKPATIGLTDEVTRVIDGGEMIEVDLKVEKARPLILADTYDPGWRAFVDGRETHIYRANYVQRMIYLPAGAKQVRFIYEPQAVRVGLGVSLVALATFLGLQLWAFALMIRSRFFVKREM